MRDNPNKYCSVESFVFGSHQNQLFLEQNATTLLPRNNNHKNSLITCSGRVVVHGRDQTGPAAAKTAGRSSKTVVHVWLSAPLATGQVGTDGVVSHKRRSMHLIDRRYSWCQQMKRRQVVADGVISHWRWSVHLTDRRHSWCQQMKRRQVVADGVISH